MKLVDCEQSLFYWKIRGEELVTHYSLLAARGLCSSLEDFRAKKRLLAGVLAVYETPVLTNKVRVRETGPYKIPD